MKVNLKNSESVKWYLATLVMVITIEGETRNVVHKNLHLIQAESDANAFEKALVLGSDTETSYLNSRDQQVDISFYGIAELEETIELDIYDGVELTFREFEGLSGNELEKLVPLKEDLGVFFTSKPTEAEDELDYGSKEIRAMVNETIE